MSSAVSARPPGGQHRDPELTPTKDQPKTGALGLTSATMLVIGTVIGAGVFTMPAVLASAGTISLAVLAVIAAGAMVLAILFLSARPTSARSMPRAAACTRRSGSPPEWRFSRSSAWRPRPSPPSG